MDLTKLSISEAGELLRNGDLKSVELTAAHLNKISEIDPQLNAYITVTGELAQQQAEAADEILQQYGKKNAQPVSPLRGIPVAVKDLYETQGIRTTAGSKIYYDYIPPANAAVIDRFYTAGAVLLGKLNMHEIALGVTTVNPHFGTCKNPWSLDRISGGSSGGSASALMAGLCMGSLGTDTGGSIRIPSSLCGCVGIKPTYGRVSVRGVMPLSWNLDHVGPMARNVEDVALLLETISGYDPLDPYSVNRPSADYLAHIKDSLKGWRIAQAKGKFFSETTDPEVAHAISEAAKVFHTLGAETESVDFSVAREAAYANGIMTVSDAAAVYEDRINNQPEYFCEDVRQRLQTGAAVTATQYVKARRTQSLLRYECIRFFENYDLLITPTTAVAAPPIFGPNAVDQAALLTRFTGPFNLAGLPAISIFCGFTKHHLPIGLQICGPPWSEAKILQAAYAYEQETQ